jgi:hypothetical protein
MLLSVKYRLDFALFFERSEMILSPGETHGVKVLKTSALMCHRVGHMVGQYTREEVSHPGAQKMTNWDICLRNFLGGETHHFELCSEELLRKCLKSQLLSPASRTKRFAKFLTDKTKTRGNFAAL